MSVVCMSFVSFHFSCSCCSLGGFDSVGKLLVFPRLPYTIYCETTHRSVPFSCCRIYSCSTDRWLSNFSRPSLYTPRSKDTDGDAADDVDEDAIHLGTTVSYRIVSMIDLTSYFILLLVVTLFIVFAVNRDFPLATRAIRTQYQVHIWVL